MNEETFQRKLAELIAEIGSLPVEERGKMMEAVAFATDKRKELKETLASLQESIDFLRLSIKYMLFDLEATRRENAQLSKMLQEQRSDPPELPDMEDPPEFPDMELGGEESC